MNTARAGTDSNRSILGRALLSAAVCAAALLFTGGCATGGGQNTQADADNRAYSFWPPLPNEPRIQFLTSYRYTSDVEPPQSGLDKLVFGSEQVVLPIGKPYGVAMWDGRIYVCDVTNPGILILDVRNRETRLMGVTGADPMSQPVDLAIASDGTKYVVDRVLKRIFVFDANDKHVASFAPEGATPVGVAIRGNELVVPDFASQTVLVLDRFSGQVKGSMGKAGGGEGGFIRPLGVATDASGDTYVTDVIQGNLQRFDRNGNLIFRVGQIADSAGNFVRPKHIAVDSEGIIYIVDAAFQNVQMFDNDGKLLMFFGSPGAHAGSMSLPAGIDVYEGDLDLYEQYLHPAFEARRLVLVTNQFGLHKVSVYAMGGLKPGKTVADIAGQAAAIETGLWTEDQGGQEVQLDSGQAQPDEQGESGDTSPQPEEPQTPQP